ncbi:MAG TPA: CHASE3 domain-containing protein [Candidatus Angelobacter sp.]|nr:CHASE3 domain-containing protein [Candidatus Angelobacter sp.]
MPSAPHALGRLVLAYLCAVTLPPLVVMVRTALDPAIKDNPGLILFVFPILLSAYLGGLIPGLMATALSGLLASYYLLAPLHSFSISGRFPSVQWIGLLAAGTLLSILMSSLRRKSMAQMAPQRTPRFSLERKVQFAFAFALVCLVFIGFFSYASLVRAHRELDRVTHTQAVIASMYQVLALADEAESGQRGYAITGTESFLEPYTTAKPRIGPEFNRLKGLIDDPVQQRKLAEAESLLARRLARIDVVVAARRDQGLAAAQALIASGEGKRLQDQLRMVMSEMQAAELDSLREHDLRAGNAVRFTTTVILFGTTFGFSLVIVALFLIGRDFSGARSARADLLQANNDLEHRVQERTAELLRTNEALQASRDRLTLALDMADLGTWDRYLPDNRTEWSPRALAAFGLPPETELSFEQFLALVHPEDRTKMQQAREGSWKTGADLEIEFRTTWSDGSLHWIAARGRPHYDQSGKPVRARGVLRDISREKLAEEAQLRSQKLESLGTLAGGIAHDFNNILLAIRGNVDLACEDLPPGHPAQQSLMEVRKSARRAADLVRRILSFGNQRDQKREVVQAKTVVMEAVNLMRATLPAKIELRTTFAPALSLVAIDCSQIQQVVVNLVTNSFHAIGASPGLIEVRLGELEFSQEESAIHRVSPGRYVALEVKDNGCGMEHATLQRACDPFFTTKPVGQGTGLGLFMVEGIARSHGGGIALSSELGRGTTFRVFLPIAHQRAEAAPISVAAVSHGNHQRVLYVDDEEALVSLITRKLTRLGYEVTGMADPEAALREFSAAPQNFDAVVTDLAMPSLSGFEFLARVLALRPEIPAVLTSGYVQPEDHELARKMGVRKVILKPNTVDELGMALNELLQTSTNS